MSTITAHAPDRTKKPAKAAGKRASTKKAQGKAPASSPDLKQERALTPKQEAFCLAYLETGNASEAYRKAYNASRMSDPVIHNKASALLAKGEIRVRLEELRQPAIDNAQVTVERVLQEAARLAFADVRQLYRPDGTLIPVHELNDDIAAAITGVDVIESVGEGGNTTQTKKYKLADKNAAIERLFKHLGMYERDNSQKVDPLAAVLQSIASRSSSAFMPVEDED